MMSAAREWQSRRGQLNHNWLKNEFLPMLGKWLNVLAGEVEDEIFEERVWTILESEWPQRSEEIALLLEDFSKDMSPRLLFLVPPLAGCDEETKGWLGELIHQRWVESERVQNRLLDAGEQFRRANSAFAALMDQRQVRSDDAQRMLEAATAFRIACESLGRSLSGFPSEVEVP